MLAHSEFIILCNIIPEKKIKQWKTQKLKSEIMDF